MTDNPNEVPQTGATGGGIGDILALLGQLLFGANSGSLMSFFQRLLSSDPAPVDPSASANGGAPRRSGGMFSDIFNRTVGRFFPPDRNFSSATALSIAATDGAGEGRCAEGVGNILERQGYNIIRGDGHNWDTNLSRSGWVRLEGVSAQNAPEGAVLVYDSDVQRGRAPRNGRNGRGGDEFGHTEIVCYDRAGNRTYVSDEARARAGGSVPNNYVGAYIPRDRYEEMVRLTRQAAQPDIAPAGNVQAATSPRWNVEPASAAFNPSAAGESRTAPMIQSQLDGPARRETVPKL